MIKYSRRLSAFFLLLLPSTILTCTNDSEDILEEPKEEKINTCDNPLFIEEDGLVKGDFEIISNTNGWEVNKSIVGFKGTGYLIWKGNDSFTNPGIAKLTYKIQVTNPGTYQFVWRTRIVRGDSNTGANDTWLRFPDADDFYGIKDTGNIVYPKGSGKTPLPEGAGKNGWFKVYMNRKNEWFWRSNTSDNDPHNIFVEFKNTGMYTMEISARSAYHAVDRFVLFQNTVISPTAPDVPLSMVTCN